ncbi:AfsR/SARP family transcriptional regulator [Spirillospora sp. CA-255316]
MRTDHADIPLTPQRQLLLAILIMAAGRPVNNDTLVGFIWEDREIDDPIGALRTNIAHLRTRLGSGADGRKLIPHEAAGYRLLVDPHDVDVHRFRHKLAQARSEHGPEALRLTQEALREWGPESTGLNGGHPLSGLTESWANSHRARLQSEYRDARLFCLNQAWNSGAYDEVAAECDELANDAEAFQDEQFVGLWMCAAYRTRGRNRALDIYSAAEDAMTRMQGLEISRDLSYLAARIRKQDRELGPCSTPALLSPAAQPLSQGRSNTSTLAQAAHAKQETPMSERESKFTFNNHPGANVGAQGEIHGAVTVHVGEQAQQTESEESPQDTGELSS